jgi:hypothetical protein
MQPLYFPPDTPAHPESPNTSSHKMIAMRRKPQGPLRPKPRPSSGQLAWRVRVENKLKLHDN